MLVWQPEQANTAPHIKSQLLWSSSVAQALSILLLYHLQHDLPSCLHLSQLEKKRGKGEHTPSFYRHDLILVPTSMFYIWLQRLLGDQLGTQEWILSDAAIFLMEFLLQDSRLTYLHFRLYMIFWKSTP